MNKTPNISIILPCLNEEKSIGKCIEDIKNVIKSESLDAEIIVVDNDSEDQSYLVVSSYLKDTENLKLFKEKNRGYGSTYLRGLSESTGKYIFMADSDNTYDFKDIPRFISRLESGNDLVIGNRFSEKINSDTMPFLHKYIGNPILSLITRIFFKIKIKDIHCGARAISKDALNKITLYTTGMEFASEMIIKCAKKNLKITEIPIKYHPRIGESKLETFRDGWRHLRFILLYSPIVIFLIPGILLFISGIISLSLLNKSSVNSIFLSSSIIILGYQFIFFAVFSRIYAITHLGEKDKIFEKLFKIITIEKAGLAGISITLITFFIYIFMINKNISDNINWIEQTKILTTLITFSVLGFQTIASSFMLSILGIKEK